MYFRQLLHDDHSCASYVVGCPSHDVCAVIDPQGDPRRYVDLASSAGLRISHVIDTHIHADHRSAARDLSGVSEAPLFLGERADVGFEFEGLSEDELLRIGNRRLRVLHTPGHTPEHVTLFVDDWFLLTGDTLFVGDVGRVDLALEDIDESELRLRAKELHASLQRLLDLPDYVEVYPGHYAGSTCGRGMDGKPISTMGRERRTNEALTLDVDAFVDFQLASAPPLPADFERIKSANLGRAEDAAAGVSRREDEGGGPADLTSG